MASARGATQLHCIWLCRYRNSLFAVARFQGRPHCSCIPRLSQAEADFHQMLPNLPFLVGLLLLFDRLTIFSGTSFCNSYNTLLELYGNYFLNLSQAPQPNSQNGQHGTHLRYYRYCEPELETVS